MDDPQPTTKLALLGLLYNKILANEITDTYAKALWNGFEHELSEEGGSCVTVCARCVPRHLSIQIFGLEPVAFADFSTLVEIMDGMKRRETAIGQMLHARIIKDAEVFQNMDFSIAHERSFEAHVARAEAFEPCLRPELPALSRPDGGFRC